VNFRYIFIDDESAARIKSLCSALSHRDLTVEHQNPLAFEDQLAQLRRTDEGFGLILDHRLDEAINDGARRHYRGFTLAQEIRTRATDADDGTAWSYPIVLLSMQVKLKRSYDRDLTSHDLFDAVYAKENVPEQAETISQELRALVLGYAQLREARTARDADDLTRKLLGTNVDPDSLDPRLLGELVVEGRPCHVYAHFILKKLLAQPGPLLDERYLAARLGVSLEKSTDWSAVKDSFESFRYRGAFHEAWERWWARDLERWWSSLRPRREPLVMMEAAERVRALKEVTGRLGLVAAEPIREGYEQRYWTVCSELDRPLDPVDAVRIAEPEPRPWQEPHYISLQVAVEGLSRRDLRPHRMEEDRVNALRASET
jgi:hypothetical protein